MTATAWDTPLEGGENVFGFIGIDEHTHKGCVIQCATDLGVRLIMLDSSTVPIDFVLFSFDFNKSYPCKTIRRTDEVIDAWIDSDGDVICND
ncbi:MAG: PilZ domain-containing protein [Methylobacterium sp.]|jgi:hypothetical protein|uniref:PilZ domain-containing protein n=1 Tax=unclassified Methylobacterium TaxID=2615210 RepID=UPI0011CC2A47|nr:MULTISPECIES: PilZ domain-containing protein [unclassified Methylobacterium]MDO9427811.1 PilZ domain-containing protein [Methylobacterium sp.]TXM73872.1 PilZ domain-containing protein [Methylobacterium sp. WL69]